MNTTTKMTTRDVGNLGAGLRQAPNVAALDGSMGSQPPFFSHIR